jgi:hypothetical protein
MTYLLYSPALHVGVEFLGTQGEQIGSHLPKRFEFLAGHVGPFVLLEPDNPCSISTIAARSAFPVNSVFRIQRAKFRVLKTLFTFTGRTISLSVTVHKRDG